MSHFEVDTEWGAKHALLDRRKLTWADAAVVLSGLIALHMEGYLYQGKRKCVSITPSTDGTNYLVPLPRKRLGQFREFHHCLKLWGLLPDELDIRYETARDILSVTMKYRIDSFKETT